MEVNPSHQRARWADACSRALRLAHSVTTTHATSNTTASISQGPCCSRTLAAPAGAGSCSTQRLMQDTVVAASPIAAASSDGNQLPGRCSSFHRCCMRLYRSSDC